ncbi:MAG: ATP-binding protein [Actinomycetes bacterium]
MPHLRHRPRRPPYVRSTAQTPARPGTPASSSPECSSEWDLDDLQDTIVLLVSEVVTNALRHTEGKIELTMSHLPGRLRVEVADDISVAPRLRGGDELDDSGRGVPLLAGFSDR